MLALFLAALLQSPSPVPSVPAPPDVAAGVTKGREQLAKYQWRLKTEMKVDGVSRMLKAEDVHLGPDGKIVMQKTVRFERKPQPTPLPYHDPRAGLPSPPNEVEEEHLFDTARELMQFYAGLPPERIASWSAHAEVMSHGPDRAGRLELHGRGLGRPEDDAVVYLDPVTRDAVEIEVKTSVSIKIVDIAFLRVVFEPLPSVAKTGARLIVPKRIFLNMNQGKRRVTLEMETSDFRTWQ